MTTQNDLKQLSRSAGEALGRAGLTLATAESCTGGLISKLITDIAGSSEWFGYGFVTYSNDAKRRLLGVRIGTLKTEGAVSDAVVREMVTGAQTKSRADLALAVSGVAGPGGGSEDKPVGTVWFAWSDKNNRVTTDIVRFSGNREAVRREAAAHALRRIIELAS